MNTTVEMFAQQVQKARKNVKQHPVESKNRFDQLYRDRTYERYRHRKMIRLIRHEALDFSGGCGIIGSPQMSRQSERSA